MYSSTSAKVISLVREWYVDEVKYQIYEKFTDGSDLINSSIGKIFPILIVWFRRTATAQSF